MVMQLYVMPHQHILAAGSTHVTLPVWLTGAIMLAAFLSVLFLRSVCSQTITVPSGNSIFTQTGPSTVSATYPQPATGCALNPRTSSDASACAPVAATNGTWRSAAALPLPPAWVAAC